MIRTIASTLLCTAFVATAAAADYPPELHGSYAYAAGKLEEGCRMPAIVIGPRERTNDVDAACRVTKLAGGGAAFTLDEQCGREDSRWSQKSVMSFKGGELRIAEESRHQGKNAATYRKCPAAAKGAPVASAPVAAAPLKLSCRLNPGQAGVTTYLDEQMKRSGNPVREIDGYTFAAERKIKVGKSDLLAGRLLRADGSVAEPKSYADADEWTCN